MLLILTACSTSPPVPAPVRDGGAATATPGTTGPAGQPQTSDEIQSNPLPATGGVTRQPLSTTQPVSPVVVNLLQRSEQAAQLQQWQQAELYLERAMRISPRNALLWQRMAQTKMAQNKYDQAIQFASKSNTLAATDRVLRSRNWGIIAQAHTAMGRADKAAVAQQKARGY